MADKQTFEIIDSNNNTLWEGKADTIHFCTWHNIIASPMWARYCKYTERFIICFDIPNNIRVRKEDKDDGDIILWCEPAVTEKQLQELKEHNEALKRSHELLSQVS